MFSLKNNSCIKVIGYNSSDFHQLLQEWSVYINIFRVLVFWPTKDMSIRSVRDLHLLKPPLPRLLKHIHI